MLDFLASQFLRMREIKAQPLLCNVAAHLAHMCTQHITQRLLEQVCRGMQLRSAFSMISQTASKFILISQARALLVLLEKGVEAILINAQTMFLRQLCR